VSPSDIVVLWIVCSRRKRGERRKAPRLVSRVFECFNNVLKSYGSRGKGDQSLQCRYISQFRVKGSARRLRAAAAQIEALGPFRRTAAYASGAER